MKVLFLDIDGVVNCRHTPMGCDGFIGIDPYMAFLVGRIVIAVPELKVVLSSSWRHMEDGRREVERRVVPIYDVTPTDETRLIRGDEFWAWLREHQDVERYAILDDDDDFLNEQIPNLFKTEWETGLTEEIANAVIKHLIE